MRSRLTMVAILCTVVAHAAPAYDSLYRVLTRKGAHDTTRAWAHFDLAEYFYRNDGRLDSSLYHYGQALKYAHKSNHIAAMADAHSGLGLIYREKGIYDKALANYLSALKYAEKTGHIKRLAREYNGIAVVHAIQRDFDKALFYYKKSEKICSEGNYRRGLASVYNNQGLIYFDKEDDKMALHYFKKALTINQETGDMRGVATVNENTGLIYSNFRHDYKTALNHFYRSIAIWRGMGDRNSVAITLQYIGNALLEDGKYQAAIDSSLQSLQLAYEARSLVSERESYYTLYRAYEKLHKSDQALRYYKKYNEAKDSLVNMEKVRELTSMQVSYEMHEQKVKDSLETATANQLRFEKQQLVIARSRSIIWWVLAGLTVVAVFSVFLYMAFIRNRRARMEIARQKVTIEQRSREVTDSIRYASRIQEAILPPAALLKKLIPDHFVFYLPKDIVSGDFYWVDEKDGKIFIAVVDCTGHGVPGAFMSIVGRNGLHEALHLKNLTGAADILDFLNAYVMEALHHNNKQTRVADGMDIALICWEKNRNKLFFAGANNPAWVVRKSATGNPDFIELTADKFAIGFSPEAERRKFSQKEFTLQPGDMICLFSDGFADQFGGPKGKKLKYEQLRRLLLENASRGTETVHKHLADFFATWKGDLEQIDDVCVLGFKHPG